MQHIRILSLFETIQHNSAEGEYEYAAFITYDPTYNLETIQHNSAEREYEYAAFITYDPT